MTRRILGWTLAACLLLPGPAMAADPSGTAEAAKALSSFHVSPKATQALREMSDYLKSLKSFSFTANITSDEIIPLGPRVQHSRTTTVKVKRPDRLLSVTTGDDQDAALYYDGKTMTIVDKKLGINASAPVPADIDNAIEHLIATYGVNAPMAELLYNDPYPFLMENVVLGWYVGEGEADGVACRHLSFTQADVDWQIWISQGDKPLPRKIVITDRILAGAPQFTAVLTDWKVNPSLTDKTFAPIIPAASRTIDFLPAITPPPAKK